MQYYRFGRVVVPEGGLFDDYDSAIAFIESLEEEVISEMVKDLSFTTDADGTLSVLINNKRFFITLSALKDLCKHLKIPAGFINKFPGRDLVLENLNNNPYLKENSDLVKLVIWKGEEQPVIAGVLPGEDPAMSAGEFLSLMNDGQAFERETTKLDQIAFTGEEMVVYFYLPEEMSREGYGFNLGFALHYSATRPVDTFVLPFGKMSVVANTGEPFDFDFETGTKLHVGRRKREDFLDKTIELGQTYIGDDLGVLYEDFTKYGMVARNIDSVKFAILKAFKSKATGTYNYSGMKLDPNDVAAETIPEFKQFASANREQLKSMATYSANNLPVNFFLPVFLNRIFTMQANIENPYFMVRYRKTIGGVLNKMLDEVGDVVL